MTTLDNIPPDILIEIVVNLNDKDMCSLIINKKLLEMFNNDELWIMKSQCYSKISPKNDAATWKNWYTNIIKHYFVEYCSEYTSINTKGRKVTCFIKLYDHGSSLDSTTIERFYCISDLNLII